MDANLSNKEQVEVFIKWFKDYGVSIILAVILGLGISYGWRYYQNYRVTGSLQASATYEYMLVSYNANQYDLAKRLAGKLTTKYSASPYASLARLMLAKIAVDQKQYGAAIGALQRVMKQADESSMKQIARFRLARLLSQQRKFKQALTLLAKVDDKTFLPMIDTVKGDILMAKGDQVAAIASYRTAKAAYSSLGLNDNELELKISQ